MNGLNLTFKQGTKHVIKKQEHEMCKTNVILKIDYANICKHEDEKYMTRLWGKTKLIGANFGVTNPWF
jgi:hypothetical protein